MDTQQLLDLSIEVFGDKEKARTWLDGARMSRNGQIFSPRKLLESEEGRNAVQVRLIQIQYGIYA